MSISDVSGQLSLRGRAGSDASPSRGGAVRTMNRVLITHNGFVHIVLAAPAVIADKMWSDQGCSRITGWYPFTWAAG